MKTRPVVGMKVALNDYGLDNIFGSAIGKSHMRSLPMTITWVDHEPIPGLHEDVWDVAVDNPEIDQFLIDSLCFDEVPA